MIVAALLTLAGIAAFLALGGGLSTILRSRKYKSGTGWCVWRWTETPSDYILRLHALKTPWFAICLHWINGPDQEPYIHDHPVTFLSVILRGWYGEVRKVRGRIDGVVHNWFNFIRATPEDAHRIVCVAPRGALTLCLMGPKTREWGFHTPTGWEHWKSYNDRVYKPSLTKEACDRILKAVYSPESMQELLHDPGVSYISLAREAVETTPQLALDFGDEEPTAPRERSRIVGTFTSSDDFNRSKP